MLLICNNNEHLENGSKDSDQAGMALTRNFPQHPQTGCRFKINTAFTDLGEDKATRYCQWRK